MKTYLSLIKGVNVGGKKKLVMSELKKMYERMGFSSVQTYLNSGNVLFQTDETDKKLLAASVSDNILSEFGIKADILVIDKSDLENILSLCPWHDMSGMNTSHVFVNFLFDKPKTMSIDIINAKKKDTEELHYFDRVVFMYCQEGMADSKLTTQLFERAFGVCCTARNWNTAMKLLDKM